MYSAECENTDGTTSTVPTLTALSWHRSDLGPAVPAINHSDLFELPLRAPAIWPDIVLPEALYQRAANEGITSNLVLGSAPEHWSPLGKLAHDDFARLQANLHLFEIFDAPWSGVVHSPGPDDSPVLVFSLDRRPVAAVSFFQAGFVVPIPAQAKALMVWPDDLHQRIAEDTIWPALEGLVEDGERIDLILWRVYTGHNTWIRDAVTTLGAGVHRLVVDGLEHVGLVVGRALRVYARRLGASQRDFDVGSRLKRREMEQNRRDPSVLAACPNLRAFDDRVARAVVAIHGTMSTSVNLGVALSDWTDRKACVLRYEHDTWMRVEDNAQELAKLLEERVEEAVFMVAHSRGGLVAARTTQILAERGRVSAAGLVTLGTPFSGTEVAVMGDVVLLMVHALLGGLRYLGGPVVDIGTRWLSYAVFPGEVPPGLTAMYPNSEFLPGVRGALPPNSITVAGTSGDGARTFWGLGGLVAGVFAGEENDLVVARSSALAEQPKGKIISCDHCSFLEDKTVQDLLTEQMATFKASPVPTISAPSSKPGDYLTW